MQLSKEQLLDAAQAAGYSRGLVDADLMLVAINAYCAQADAQPFQARVQPWMMACFGAEISADKQERNHRFLEEALELVQACGATASEAHQLVDYVYGRPVGEKHQEIGGVMVTLAALCLAQDEDMHAAGETELARIWTKVDQIRAKQAAKPKHSPLPQHAPAPEAAQALSDEEIRKLAVNYCLFESEGRHYNILRYEIEEDFFNFCRALLTRASAATVAEPVEAIDPGECAKDVFERGQSLGYFDIPKDAANIGCALASSLTGDRFDWHYFAGRVHVKVLKAAQQQAEPGADPTCIVSRLRVHADDRRNSAFSRCAMREAADVLAGLLKAEPGADERAAQSVNELPRVANSLGGFRGGFIGVHGRAPTEQEIWNGGVRSGLDRAAQSGQRAGVAEGWQLVPKVPTREMCHAGRYLGSDSAPPLNTRPSEDTAWPIVAEHTAANIFAAMLAAAPTQQQEGES